MSALGRAAVIAAGGIGAGLAVAGLGAARFVVLGGARRTLTVIARPSRGTLRLPRVDATSRPATFGLRGERGQLYVVGGRVTVGTDRVDREIDPGARVAEGEWVEFVGNVFGSDSALVRAASVATWRGAGAPHRVWEFEPGAAGGVAVDGPTFVHVHGLGAAPASTLRSVDAVGRLGHRSSIVSLDGNPDLFARVRGVRATALARVTAAIDRAAGLGSGRVVLVGWSFGGQLALQAAAGRDDVAGVVLISPTTDLLATMRAEAQSRGVPRVIAALGATVLTTPGLSRLAGLDRALPRDSRHLAATRDLPRLVMHSPGDATLTMQPGAEQHGASRGRVTFAEFPPVPHTMEWNADPKLFERALGLWLRSGALD